MDNHEAIAYAVIAIGQLKKEGKEVNDVSLKGKMLSLMDRYSESEIYRKYSENRLKKIENKTTEDE